MAITVACLTAGTSRHYKRVANAMAEGIVKCGDNAFTADSSSVFKPADVGLMYGWKHSAQIKRYPNFMYADLAYWSRDTHYRFSVNGWSPDKYVRGGHDKSRFEKLGLTIDPWKDHGSQIIVVGSSRKAAVEHGFGYMKWERDTCNALRCRGLKIEYRPKPSDKEKTSIHGVGYDLGSTKDSLFRAKAIVTHHSNMAIDALLAGVPVHCETGAAAAFSVPLDSIGEPERLEGREQFLYDVAWLQWSLEEMRSGEAWSHLKTLLC